MPDNLGTLIWTLCYTAVLLGLFFLGRLFGFGLAGGRAALGFGFLALEVGRAAALLFDFVVLLAHEWLEKN